jgi:hypothetical protein
MRPLAAILLPGAVVALSVSLIPWFSALPLWACALASGLVVILSARQLWRCNRYVADESVAALEFNGEHWHLELAAGPSLRIEPLPNPLVRPMLLAAEFYVPDRRLHYRWILPAAAVDRERFRRLSRALG